MQSFIQSGAWIFILEAGIPLFLLLFIVWWTMFPSKKPKQPNQPTATKHTSQKEDGTSM